MRKSGIVTAGCACVVLCLQCAPAAAIALSTRQRNQAFMASDRSHSFNLAEPVKDLIFLHIPKNAGNAIEDAAHDVNIPWGKNMDFKTEEWDSWVVNTHCSQWHIPPRYISKPNVYSYPKLEVFCVVRHPYARAVSEFRWEAIGKGFNCTPNELNSFWRDVLSDYQKNRFTRDCHILPQSEYIWDMHGEQVCTHLFDVPSLPASLNNFFQKNHYDVRLPAREDSHREACGDLRPKDFDDDVLAMLNQIYRKDFEKLAYMGFAPHGRVNHSISAADPWASSDANNYRDI